VTAMAPVPYRVIGWRAESPDTATLALEPGAVAIPAIRPGQFTMLYAFGVGEAPISVSRTGPIIEQTVRDVGAVSHALCSSRPGHVLGVRGPFGVGWGIERAAGRDIVLVAGGIGLAPLRPALQYVLEHRDLYGEVAVLVGARTPEDLLYGSEPADWRAQGVQVEVTVDRAREGWTGQVGVVTGLGGHLDAAFAGAAAFVCGPEIMMRAAARELLARGIQDIRISLERNMRCGIGWCGHCQLGPWLLCRDGPVVSYRDAAPLLRVKEL
jgi:anaerobic sulfite reductase subunit B